MAALAVATRQGHVVYERFYEAFSEAEKAEVRGAFDQVAGPSSGSAAPAEEEELVGRYRWVPQGSSAGEAEGAHAWAHAAEHFAPGRKTASVLCQLRTLRALPLHAAAGFASRNGRIVAIPAGELVFYALGTGEYSELARERGWHGNGHCGHDCRQLRDLMRARETPCGCRGLGWAGVEGSRGAVREALRLAWPCGSLRSRQGTAQPPPAHAPPSTCSYRGSGSAPRRRLTQLPPGWRCAADRALAPRAAGVQCPRCCVSSSPRTGKSSRRPA